MADRARSQEARRAAAVRQETATARAPANIAEVAEVGRKPSVIASLLSLNDRRKAELERRLKRLRDTKVPVRPQPASPASPELRGFLAAQGLVDHCYVTHMCATYDGRDAPSRGEGRLKRIRAWLQQFASLEMFKDSDRN